MVDHRWIIDERFGGIRRMQAALGHRNASTIQGWRMRGVIPVRKQHDVLEAARRLGIALEPAEFIEGQKVAA
jgi:hypothetical protein